MYTLVRFILILVVMLAAAVAALVLKLYPALVVVIIIGAIWRAGTARRHSTAHGTALWAEPSDIPHMLDGDGLILGRMGGRASMMLRLRSLLNPRLSSRLACQRFLAGEHVVRLTDSIHTAIFAPTGRGKGVSVVVPPPVCVGWTVIHTAPPCPRTRNWCSPFGPRRYASAPCGGVTPAGRFCMLGWRGAPVLWFCPSIWRAQSGILALGFASSMRRYSGRSCCSRQSGAAGRIDGSGGLDLPLRLRGLGLRP